MHNNSPFPAQDVVVDKENNVVVCFNGGPPYAVLAKHYTNIL